MGKKGKSLPVASLAMARATALGLSSPFEVHVDKKADMSKGEGGRNARAR